MLLDVGSRIAALSTGRLVPSPLIPQQPPSASPVPVAPPKAVDRRHVARDGETFETIAQAYYGSPWFAKALWWANRGAVAWPGALAAGKSIVIPRADDLDQKLIGPRPPATLPDLERIAARPDAPRIDPAVRPAGLSIARAVPEGGVAVHIVGPDDTIRSIARAWFGDDSRAREIADLNRDLLQAEGRPRVGQRLILPDPSTTRE